MKQEATDKCEHCGYKVVDKTDEALRIMERNAVISIVVSSIAIVVSLVVLCIRILQ